MRRSRRYGRSSWKGGLNVKAKDLASLIEFELTFLDETAEYCRKKLKECEASAEEKKI
ncbi:hypothetical protein [Thermococcus sp. JCM 11816]|uniref:hypothetical protein n=1 Tax=Thermococcus sp. (strain JCM 11816 / KS-1) TaxID=1295125 RepID=UPI003466CC51